MNKLLYFVKIFSDYDLKYIIFAKVGWLCSTGRKKSVKPAPYSRIPLCQGVSCISLEGKKDPTAAYIKNQVIYSVG